MFGEHIGDEVVTTHPSDQSESEGWAARDGEKTSEGGTVW